MAKLPRAANTSTHAAYTHEDLQRRHTGRGTDIGSWIEGDRAKKIVDAQSDRIADRLEACGIEARRPQTLTAISAVTLQEDLLESLRPIRIIPSVAGRERRPHLNGLRFWMHQNPHVLKYIRYAVITYGQPIPIGGDLREAITELTKRISRWASYIKKRYNIEVLYRGIEYTREIRGDDEDYTYHLHANVLYWPHEYREDWSKFLSSSWRRLKNHWQDNDRIDNVEEIVKYVIKPEDLEKVGEDELVWLYEATFKKQISAPMGCFREFLSNLRKDRKKIVQVEEVGLRITTKARRLAHVKRKVMEGTSHSGPAKNVILGVTLPQRRHTPWAEPMILVQNYDPKATGKAAEDFRRELQAIHMEYTAWWRENGGPDPETALKLAEAYRSGAVNVEPIRKAGRRPSYRVHKSSVIAHIPETELPFGTPANDAEPKIDTLNPPETEERDRSFGNGNPRAPFLRTRPPKRG